MAHFAPQRASWSSHLDALACIVTWYNAKHERRASDISFADVRSGYSTLRAGAPRRQREADSRSGLRTDTAPEWWLIGAVLREPTDIAPGHWLMGLHIRRSGLRAPLHFCHFWNRKQAEALFAKLRTQLWRPKLRIAKWRFSGCSFGESRSDS